MRERGPDRVVTCPPQHLVSRVHPTGTGAPGRGLTWSGFETQNRQRKIMSTVLHIQRQSFQILGASNISSHTDNPAKWGFLQLLYVRSTLIFMKSSYSQAGTPLYSAASLGCRLPDPGTVGSPSLRCVSAGLVSILQTLFRVSAQLV